MNRAEVKFEKVSYAGWANCLRLRNGATELIATTDVGPRIIRLGTIDGPNLLKENSDQLGKTGGTEFRAYGGHRFWHAPEIMPRTYAPDNEPVESQWNGRTLSLRQKIEESTGIQKELQITPKDDGSFQVRHRMTNRNAWTIEAAPWALTVMNGPGVAVFPHEPAVKQLLPVRPLVLWGYTDMADPRWTWGSRYILLRCDPVRRTAQKVGMLNTLGWSAYAAHGYIFIKRFGFDPAATYPDWNCNNESYTDGDMLEVESLGPLGRIEPGASVEHVEHWYLFPGELPDEETALERDLTPLLKKTEAVE